MLSSRDQSILFFHLFIFPAILFLITYYAQYFAQNLPILLSINETLLQYIKLKSTCDCSVQIFHNLATVLFDLYLLSLLYIADFNAIILCAKFLSSQSTLQKLYLLCQHFAHCFYHPIFPKNLLAKSTCPQCVRVCPQCPPPCGRHSNTSFACLVMQPMAAPLSLTMW